MKKSSKKPRRYLHLAFWLCILAGALWVVFAPKQQSYRPQIVHAQVEQPKPQEAETAPAPTGDEKTQPQPEAQPEVQLPAVEQAPKRAGHKAEIAIIIDDVGLDMRGSQRATELPSFVTLSFMPYATRLREQTREARDHGHELMLHMPMEPVGHDDPGPGALLVGLPADEIRERLENALASFTGFDGINNHMGSKFTADADGMNIVMDELQPRHLFFLDSRTSAKSVGETLARQHGVATIARDVFLDDDMNIDAIRKQLEQTEHVARRKGYAVAIGHPHATTLQALEEWLPQAQTRGFTFVPVRQIIYQP